MKKSILLITILVLVSILSFKVDWFYFLLAAVLLLTILLLILLGIISIFRRPGKKLISILYWIGIICITGILASLFTPYNEPIIETKNTSDNLTHAYQTDQKDRQKLRSYITPISKMEYRDSLRLEQVRNYQKSGELRTAMDKFHAAFIFHHSDNKADYRTASELAKEAASSEELSDNYTVQWLSRAAYDRYMVSIGKPEKYNTQNNFSLEIN